MGGGSSPNSTTYQTSISQPWSGVQGNMIEAMGLERSLVGQPQNIFPWIYNQGYNNLLQQGQAYLAPDTQKNYAGWYSGTGTPYIPSLGGGSPYAPSATTDGSAGAGVTPTGTTAAATDPSGYYQNFLTGQNMPYSSYIPYTSQVAGFNPYQTTALGQVADIAMQGDPLAASATGMLSNTLQGNYLSPQSNPYLQATYQAAAQPVMNNYLNAVYPSLRSSAAQAGQFGSSSDALMQGQAGYNLGQTLQSLGTGIYGQNYQAERANQMKAALEAPAISAEAFTYPQALMGAGTSIQQQQQQQLSDMVRQWTQQANYPQTQLQNYVAGIAGLPISGGTTASQTTGLNPYYVSPGNQFLGTASSLGGLGLGTAGLLWAMGLI